jgi:hypothetical protein
LDCSRARIIAAGSNSYPVLLKFASSSSHILCSIENNGGTINFSATADNLTPVIGAVTIGNFASTNALGFSADNVVALYTWRLNGTTCDCFINGVLVDTLTMSSHGAAVTAAISTASAGAGWSAAGAIQAWWVHNRPLDQAEIVQLATSPWCMLANVAAPDPYLFDGGGATGYTLALASGSFALTGQAALLKFNRTVAAAQGSFTLSGKAVSFTHTYPLTAAKGTFTLTGNAAGLTFNRALTAARGTFTLTGNAATLTYTPVGGYNLTAAAGGYTLSGQAAGLLFNRGVVAAKGTFTLTGNAVGLFFDRALAAARGAYTFTGNAVNFTDTPVSGAYSITAAGGSFVLSGMDARLVGPPSAIGHAGRSRKRRVIIRDRVYEVTEVELASLLASFIDDEPVQVKPVRKVRKAVEFKGTEVPELPAIVEYEPRRVQMLWLSLVQQNIEYAAVLESILRERDEDDVETLLLLH